MEKAIVEVNGLIKRLKTFESNFKKCSAVNRTKGYLSGRLSGAKELWDEACEANEKILALRTDSNAQIEYFANDIFGQMEEQYFILVGNINEQLAVFNPQPQNNAGGQGGRNHERDQQNGQSNVKLPKISLPSFSGSYHTWVSFKNRFSSLIHSNAALTDVERMEYLKSCTTGKAARAIARFQVTDQNYQVAWDRLNDKYDNQRILQVTQIETMIDLKAVVNESASELRELIDIMQDCLEALKNLNVDVTTWDPMLIVLLTRKLPFETRALWEQTLKPTDVPNYAQLCTFLEQRYRSLECLEIVSGAAPNVNNRIQGSHQNAVNRQSNQRFICSVCNNEQHSLTMCDQFLNMPIPNRNALVNAKKICKNCLATSHTLQECRSQKSCFKCGRKHHTLLHREDFQPTQQNWHQSNTNSNPFNQPSQRRTYLTNNSQSEENNTAPQIVQPIQDPQIPQNAQSQSLGPECQQRRALTTAVNDQSKSIGTQEGPKETLFPTAIIKVKSSSGTVYSLRALLDQCSDGSFIKSSVAKMLSLKTIPTPEFNVTGLEDVVTSTINSETKFNMVVDNTETINVDAFVVSTLIGVLPRAEVKWPNEIFKNIKLADPSFATPGNVDIMLGGKIFSQIILDGVLKDGGYVAQNTKIGWIISGRSDGVNQPKNCLTTRISTNIDEKETDVKELLQKFWELEEPPKRKKTLTTEEQECERLFKRSYRRLQDGRVQVKLPFKQEPATVLGASRNLAVARWIAMEKKLDKNPDLKEDYMKAIQEHWDLSHMMRADTRENDHCTIGKDGKFVYGCYYIPHHAVVKEESVTTKTRIVFDASARTSTRVSLNDTLMIGPTIQKGLILRILLWRCHKYALRGDITKMYRQIKVYPEDVNYQRMVFRFNKDDPIEDFCLNTLTFGTASAPYLAIKALEQVAEDEVEKFPVGSKVVKSDFHVDDLLTGEDTIEKVATIWKETRDLLESAKFPMRKWSSNSTEILQQIPEEDREIKSTEIKVDDSVKTLGIGWLPLSDMFFFIVPKFDSTKTLTKRTFLSQAASLFDPLGWLAPAIVKPKIMFQSLWKEGVEWDETLPGNLAEKWIAFRDKLKFLEEIRIPRWFGFTSNGFSIELHGFCDASVSAYGAVIYIKSTNSNGTSQVNLVIAKSRVAPVQTIRLPRLELCGGLLLAELMRNVSEELKIEKYYCWTDSSITLAWVDSSPEKHKIFVANRISEIQSLTNSKCWRHVDTNQNPADCLSRGIDAEELKAHNLWWHGPKWLVNPKGQWPRNPNVRIPEDEMEYKGVKVLLTSYNDFMSSLVKRYSSFQLLAQVTARIRRLFLKHVPKTRGLLVKEIDREKSMWIKLAQESAFHVEIKLLKEKKLLPSKSKLLCLNPFIDESGMLRIGGRLKEALVDYDSKHQIIIPKESHVAKLIINDAHRITKHGGTQLTTVYTRNRYWIINTRQTVRTQIKKCVICRRYAKQVQEQLMGNLPEPRVTMSRAFLHTGVDYAGPIEVLTVRKPGQRRVSKGYIVVFVCFCTKAIHLELVSDMTSEAFLAAFKRFYSRRGLPSHVYSDNGKTFVGASNELEEYYQIIKETLEPELADIVLKDNVQWSFIPPSAPHFGGLWEAGVKSTKFHFARMIGLSVHTYEEIYTMLTEIEACLNSRPLCPVTNDPDDLSVLTPGHFLIGTNLLAPPRPSLLDYNVNRLSKWKQISQRVEHFTQRWKAEYLSRLQNRTKWMRQCENVKVGNMVLIKDDNLPPSKWLLGRVTEVFEDKDGMVRKVNVKTATTTLFRPITKVSILPIDEPIEAPPSN